MPACQFAQWKQFSEPLISQSKKILSPGIEVCAWLGCIRNILSHKTLGKAVSLGFLRDDNLACTACLAELEGISDITRTQHAFYEPALWTQITVRSGEARGCTDASVTTWLLLQTVKWRSLYLACTQSGTQMMAQLIVTHYYFGLLSQVFWLICHYLLLNTALY